MGRIKIKLKRCVYCNLDKPIFRNAPRKGPQCLDCYKREKMRSKNFRKNRKTENKKKKILEAYQTGSLTKLVRIADNCLSTYIRKIFRLDNGQVPCYTCGTPLKFTEAQCGHFVKRGNWSTRWLPDNCRPQCAYCNETLEGNYKVFEERLESEFPGLPEHLKRLGNEVFRPTPSDLKEIIEDLKEKIKGIK